MQSKPDSTYKVWSFVLCLKILLGSSVSWFHARDLWEKEIVTNTIQNIFSGMCTTIAESTKRKSNTLKHKGSRVLLADKLHKRAKKSIRKLSFFSAYIWIDNKKAVFSSKGWRKKKVVWSIHVQRERLPKKKSNFVTTHGPVQFLKLEVSSRDKQRSEKSAKIVPKSVWSVQVRPREMVWQKIDIQVCLHGQHQDVFSFTPSITRKVQSSARWSHYKIYRHVKLGHILYKTNHTL